MVGTVRLVHLSDIHFGIHCDLAQVRALERFVAEQAPTATVLAGDLTQRGRHGEFQRALVFVETLQRTAPVLVIPGNHDVEWWKSLFHLFGTRVLYRKYRRYFGEDLAPSLEVPGAILAGALSAYGIAPGSMTWNLNDMAVKGHLPASETERLAARFAAADPARVRVAVLHHNVLRGKISRRMGLAHWQSAQRRLGATGADLVLCGHDHQESVGQLESGAVVVSASTHSNRTRGRHPSVFNLIEVDATQVVVRQQRWDVASGAFHPAEEHRHSRLPRASRPG